MANTIKIKRRVGGSGDLGALAVGELGVNIDDNNKLYVGTSAGNKLTALPTSGGTITGTLNAVGIIASSSVSAVGLTTSSGFTLTSGDTYFQGSGGVNFNGGPVSFSATAHISSNVTLYSSAPVLTIQDGGTWGTNATGYIELKDSGSTMSQIGVTGDDGHLDIKQKKAGSIRMFTDDAERFTIRSNGACRLTDTSLVEWGGDTNGIYGSNADNYVAVRANNGERMRVTSTGVTTTGTITATGGTISGTANSLNVTSAYSASTTTTAIKVSTVGGYNATSGVSIDFGNDQGSYATWLTGRIAGRKDGGSWQGAMAFSVNGNSSATDLDEKLLLDTTGAKVTGTLQVTPAASEQGITIGDASKGEVPLIFKGVSGSHSIGQNGAGFFISENNAGNLDSSPRFVIDTNGNCGLGGVTAPQYKLDLGGTASSTSNTIRIAQNNGGTAIRVGSGGGSSDVTLLRVDGESSDGNHDGATDASEYGFSLRYMGTRSANANSLSLFSDNQTAGSQVEALMVMQDGSIGINCTPSYRLQVNGDVRVNSGSVFLDDTQPIRWGGTKAKIVGSNGGDYLKFYTDATERLSIASNGEVTATGNLTLNSRITFSGGSNQYLEIGTDSIALKASSGSVLWNSANSGSGSGTVNETHGTGTDHEVAVHLGSSTVGEGHKLIYNETSGLTVNNTSSQTDSTYALYVSGGIKNSTGGLFITGDGYISNRMAIATSVDSSYGIKVAGYIASYGHTTWSDQRLKDDTALWDTSEAASLVKDVPVYSYRWNDKCDAKKIQTQDRIGFLAHEVEEKINKNDLVVTSTHVDRYKSVNQTDMIPILWAALQDALKRIEDLESK